MIVVSFTVSTLKGTPLSQLVFKKDDDEKTFTSLLVPQMDCNFSFQTQLRLNGLLRKPF